MTAAVLVFGWGNRSRGDDAIGPLLVERLRACAGADARVEFLDDYQLQVEHALDLVGRERVLFVDASVDAAPPFEVRPLQPARALGLSSHALAPAALLQVFEDLHGVPPPPCTLLAIRGLQFELGAPPGAAAQAHLAAALEWAQTWLVAGPAPAAAPTEEMR